MDIVDGDRMVSEIAVETDTKKLLASCQIKVGVRRSTKRERCSWQLTMGHTGLVFELESSRDQFPQGKGQGRLRSSTMEETLGVSCSIYISLRYGVSFGPRPEHMQNVCHPKVKGSR
jgi:hypothetical protein